MPVDRKPSPRGWARRCPGKVKRSSLHTVVPLQDLIAGPKSVYLGVLDHVSAPHLIIKIPFLFKQSLDPALMKASMATMLGRFPMFAGRLKVAKNGDYEVVVNNAGAELSFATCDAVLEDLIPEEISTLQNGASVSSAKQDFGALSASAYTPEDLTPFIPKGCLTLLGYRNRDIPLLQAQVTALTDGGTVVGVTLPHVLADQETCRLIMKAWGEEYTKLSDPAGDSPKREDLETETSVGASSDAPLLKNVSYLGTAIESHAVSELPPDFKSARFERRKWTFFPKTMGASIWHAIKSGMPNVVAYHVSEARLEELKKQAMASLPASAAPSSFVSTNDALAARILQMLAETGRCKDLELVVDLRRRMEPELPSPTLGNCIWTVSVKNSIPATSSAGGSAPEKAQNLGAMAFSIRSAIQSANSDNQICKELKWLKDNMDCGGSTLPVVFKDFVDIVKTDGPILISHWNWGGAEYADMAFGKAENGASVTPIWHQPSFQKVPNTVFIVPAGDAAGGGGALVHITLHRNLAAVLKSKFPSV